MATKRKTSPLFAMLFADLMIGAMGVIIVLLVFLQVVPVKGMATSVDDSSVRLPPGLLKTDDQPLVRLRIAECGNDRNDRNEHTENISIQGFIGSNEKRFLGRVADCEIYVVMYPKGLLGSTLQITTKNGQSASVETHISVTVGGYFKEETIDVSKEPNEILAFIAIGGEVIDAR